MKATLGSRLRTPALLMMLAAWPAQAGASVVLDFSDVSSDSTPAAALNAIVEFETVGTQLHVEIENLSNYRIAQLFFNSDPTLTSLAFADTVNSAWTVVGSGTAKTRKADGMGLFNWQIDFGSGAGRLPAVSGTDLILTMTGTTTGAGIMALSAIPPGNRQVWSVLKFEAGPGDDSAFGGSTTTVVPEPATMLLVASGVALAARRRRKA